MSFLSKFQWHFLFFFSGMEKPILKLIRNFKRPSRAKAILKNSHFPSFLMYKAIVVIQCGTGTPVRMATDKKTTNNKRQCECRNNLVPCWQNHKTVQPRPETAWKRLNKLEESYNPAIPLLGIFPKKIKTLIGKDVIPMSTKVLFTRAKIRKQPKCQSIED